MKKDNNDEIVDRVIIESTGEIVNMYPDSYIGRRKQINTDVIRNYNSEKRFVKLFDGVNDLRKYLGNQGEFTTAMSLSDYVCYEDCVIRKGGIRNGKKLGLKELSEELEIPFNTLKRNIYSLNKKGVINYSKEGSIDNEYVGDQIVVNPSIYLRGCDVNKTALALFENSKWKEYLEGIKAENN